MDKKEIYRIKSGALKSEKHELQITFGLIYDNDGVITSEFYIDESFDLDAFTGITFAEEIDFFNAQCITTEGETLELLKLDFKLISPSTSFIELVCYDCIILKDNREFMKADKIDKVEELHLHYLVLEGLQMEYCDATKQERTSGGRKFGESQMNWDNTKCGWHADKSSYNMEYYKDYKSGNVIVRFDYSSNSILDYKTFEELKKDYISILSFINGAPVKIRKECFGSYFTVGKPVSENNVTYSFRKLINNRANEYLLTNHYSNRQLNILNRIMMQNFNNYREWNKKIDLNSIVYYLNGAIQTKSLEEQFFILIIAFERLTALYAEQTGSKNIYVPTKDDYKPIKDELFAILDKYKSEFPGYLDRAKSIIGSLNHVDRLSTKDKMYGLLHDMRIDLTDDLKTLFDVVRNKAIHEGDIGQGKDGYKNVVLLNELIHELILRLIKYLGPRKSTVIFGRTIVTIDTPMPVIPVFEKKA